MYKEKKVVVEGVSIRALSKHLRANGVKVVCTTEQAGIGMMFVRTGLRDQQLLDVAKQIPHHRIDVRDEQAPLQ